MYGFASDLKLAQKKLLTDFKKYVNIKMWQGSLIGKIRAHTLWKYNITRYRFDSYPRRY